MRHLEKKYKIQKREWQSPNDAILSLLFFMEVNLPVTIRPLQDNTHRCPPSLQDAQLPVQIGR